MADDKGPMAGIVLRRWRGRIRTAEREVYTRYIAGTGGADYRDTPGNLAYQMTMRDLGDGSTEVVTLSWWKSLDDIRAFAGEDIERARYYPEDDRFLLERPETVEHHMIVAGDPGFAQT
jgi:heme-degrading monooxygenase HmoA